MPAFIDLSGKIFGRLMVLGRANNINRGAAWLCKCDCKTELVVRSNSLRSGHTKSCGCYNLDRMAERRTTHGMSSTTEYHSWENMYQRCTNEKDDRYMNYGGRGITVCSRWMSFENFYQDMGNKPEGRSIDRINNDGNYEPSNCRWATSAEQNRNMRNNRWIEYNGKRMILNDWAVEIGIKSNTLFYRLKRGWSVDRALTTQ